jgi:outer membrane protein assembly factor BamD (BamD/ComL family)
MTPPSAPGSSTGWPRACSDTSTATASAWWPASRALRRTRRILVPAAFLVGGCGSVNTYYNAEQAFEEGERLSAGARDSLPAGARASFERAAEKSGIILARDPGSRFADDALLLLGKSLARLGRHQDAVSAFQRFVERFPDSDAAAEARLRMARSERLGGDAQTARVALAPLIDAGDGTLSPEVLYERAMLDLATGEHEKAVAVFRTLLEESPEYAREHQVALAFAEAELAAGNYDAALDAYGAYGVGTTDPVARRALSLRVARALALADRKEEALSTFDGILADGPSDTLAARIHLEKGEILSAAGEGGRAGEEYAQVARLAAGTEVAAQATLQRGRLAWEEGLRDEALEILLDAFLHAPTTAWADSARAEARAVARVIHYERLADGEEAVSSIGEPDLARSTALYRLAEEVLLSEADPTAAAELFGRLAERYAESPWRPRALLAQGMLAREGTDRTVGEDALRELIREYPDTPEADSARRLLGEPVPERPEDFYASPPQLASLVSALPDVEDPMLRISDQLDRYAAAREARDRQDVRTTRERERQEPLRPPGAPGAEATQEEGPPSPIGPPFGVEP